REDAAKALCQAQQSDRRHRLARRLAAGTRRLLATHGARLGGRSPEHATLQCDVLVGTGDEMEVSGIGKPQKPRLRGGGEHPGPRPTRSDLWNGGRAWAGLRERRAPGRVRYTCDCSILSVAWVSSSRIAMKSVSCSTCSCLYLMM